MSAQILQENLADASPAMQAAIRDVEFKTCTIDEAGEKHKVDRNRMSAKQRRELADWCIQEQGRIGERPSAGAVKLRAECMLRNMQPPDTIPLGIHWARRFLRIQFRKNPDRKLSYKDSARIAAEMNAPSQARRIQRIQNIQRKKAEQQAEQQAEQETNKSRAYQETDEAKADKSKAYQEPSDAEADKGEAYQEELSDAKTDEGDVVEGGTEHTLTPHTRAVYRTPRHSMQGRAQSVPPQRTNVSG